MDFRNENIAAAALARSLSSSNGALRVEISGCHNHVIGNIPGIVTQSQLVVRSFFTPAHAEGFGS
jgi:hypothetical protein